MIVECVQCHNRWQLDSKWAPPVEVVSGRILLWCSRCKAKVDHLYRSNPKAQVRSTDVRY